CVYNSYIGNIAIYNKNSGFVFLDSDNYIADNIAHSQIRARTHYDACGIKLVYHNNTLVNNTAYNNTGGGICLNYGSTNNTFINNTVYNNSHAGGIWLHDDSNNNTFNGTLSYNNTYGFYNNYSRNITINNMHVFNNSYDFFIRYYRGQSAEVTAKNITFDNPFGNHENYTSVDFYNYHTYGTYYMNWTDNSSALPAGRISFRQKFVEVTTSHISVEIDAINFTWLDSEVGGIYDESRFELWKYNTSHGWTLLNDTPNIVDNTLSLYNWRPRSDYGILLGNASDCMEIDSSGGYQLTQNISGADIDLSETGDVNLTCIKITSSDVIFDCKGFSITNDGTANASAISVNGSAGVNYTNVTIANCPDLSGYEVGVYIHYSAHDLIENSTARNLSRYGFYVRGSQYVNITDTSAHNVSNLSGIGGIGYYINGSTGGNVSGNNAYNITREGYYINGSESLNFTNNTAFNLTAGAVGFRMSGGADYNLLYNSTAYNCSVAGIYLNGSRHNNLTDNIVSN
ncbi:TPA: hypothetical protein EYP38_04315, partial [Candidatus Micrarchaeota archaeon]|nr:hypothetical protein [Candidatus Micrarchaeota archaeon]